MTICDLKPRWFQFAPGLLVAILLIAECFIWLADRFQWASSGHHQGWPVLIAIACVGVGFLAMLVWFSVSLLFRLRFQFCIRTLLLFVVAVALPCSWLAVAMKTAKEQQEALAQLRRFADENKGTFSVRYDYQRGWDDTADPPEPALLRRLLGVDFFNTPEDVYLYATHIPEAQLEYLSRFAKPKEMVLGGLQIRDGDLKRLQRLPQITGMNICESSVTDAGLRDLSGLPELRTLCLNPQITDDGLENLGKMTQLQALWLDGTQVTDEGMKYLRNLTALRQLCLAETKVTDRGLQNLKPLSQLTDLVLHKTQVGDSGLAVITSLGQLASLDLDDTQVTDAGLNCLTKLTKLTQLRLGRTRVTNGGVKKLQQALPNCRILR